VINETVYCFLLNDPNNSCEQVNFQENRIMTLTYEVEHITDLFPSELIPLVTLQLMHDASLGQKHQYFLPCIPQREGCFDSLESMLLIVVF